MTAQLAPATVYQAFYPNGSLLAGGQLFTYAAGTTTPQATYVDSTQTTQNTNPVILNASGQANVWLDPTLSYKFVLQDKFGNIVPPGSVDNIQGILNATSLTLGAPGPGVTTLTVLGATSGTNVPVDKIVVQNPAMGVPALFVTTNPSVNIQEAAIGIQNLTNTSTSFCEIAMEGGGTTDNFSMVMTNSNWAINGFGISGMPAGQVGIISAVPGSIGAFPICFATNNVMRMQIAANGAISMSGTLTVTGAVATGALTVTGAASISGAMGVNGASPPAQVTGWGTPTGPSVQNNFSGSAAMLPQCSAAIAEIITYLKARGDFAA